MIDPAYVDPLLVAGESSITARVGLVGWNGRRNVGDDAMTATIVRFMEARYGGAVHIDVLADQDAMPAIGGEPARVRGFRGYNLVHRLPSARLRQPVRHLLFGRRFARKLDVVLFGGGSIFHSALTSQRYQRLLDAAERCVVAGAVGISLGPFEDEGAEIACRSLISRLDFVAVRDRASYEIIKRWNLPVTSVLSADLALLLPELVAAPAPHRSEDCVRLGVSLRAGAFDPAGEAAIAAGLRAALAADPARTVRLFIFCMDLHQSDHAITSRMVARLGFPGRVEVVEYAGDPVQVYARIAECNGMLATRLHAAILAAAVGTPFAVISYHPKNTAFAHDAHLPAEWIADSDAVSAGWIAETAEAVLEPRDPGVAVAALRSLQLAARRGLALVGEHLDSLMPSPSSGPFAQ